MKRNRLCGPWFEISVGASERGGGLGVKGMDYDGVRERGIRNHTKKLWLLPKNCGKTTKGREKAHWVTF